MPGTRIFLWEPKTKTLMGPLVALDHPVDNLVPNAFGGRFPCHVRFAYADWFATCRHSKRLKIGPVTPEHAFFLERELASTQQPENVLVDRRIENTPKPKTSKFIQHELCETLTVQREVWRAVTSDSAVNQLSADLRSLGHTVHVKLNRTACTCELSSPDQNALDLAVDAVHQAERRAIGLAEKDAQTRQNGASQESTRQALREMTPEQASAAVASELKIRTIKKRLRRIDLTKQALAKEGGLAIEEAARQQLENEDQLRGELAELEEARPSGAALRVLRDRARKSRWQSSPA